MHKSLFCNTCSPRQQDFINFYFLKLTFYIYTCICKMTLVHVFFQIYVSSSRNSPPSLTS